ncbi:MAG: hypothetical protein K2V38_14015, partial [Gemmataceae bacterium]|nr:hypothetical protein [Gemmataceae bacterium]
EGLAPKITSEGKRIVLIGNEQHPAQIVSRFGGATGQGGRVITYDRGAGSYTVTEGYGGSIGGSPKK